MIMNFDLTQSITWSDIVSAAAAVFTFTAVVVAMVANYKATKQLRFALAMQEQSKNIEFMEKRVSIAEQIQADNHVADMTIRLLFNDEISKCYQKISDFDKQQKDAEHDEKTYFDVADKVDADGFHSNSIKDTIEEYENLMNQPDCSTDIFNQYKKFCDDNEYYESETGLKGGIKTYNYAEISERMLQAYHQKRQIKNQLLKMIEAYIAASIQPLK